MRNMSFMLTVPQMEDRTKTVTRRLGWDFLRGTRGQIVMAVEKGQGLKKGDKVRRLYPIEILYVTGEQLCLLTEDIDYGYSELLREGFPNMHPWEFVQFFCKTHHCTPFTIVNRIEFMEHKS